MQITHTIKVRSLRDRRGVALVQRLRKNWGLASSSTTRALSQETEQLMLRFLASEQKRP